MFGAIAIEGSNHEHTCWGFQQFLPEVSSYRVPGISRLPSTETTDKTKETLNPKSQKILAVYAP